MLCRVTHSADRAFEFAMPLEVPGDARELVDLNTGAKRLAVCRAILRPNLECERVGLHVPLDGHGALEHAEKPLGGALERL